MVEGRKKGEGRLKVEEGESVFVLLWEEEKREERCGGGGGRLC